MSFGKMRVYAQVGGEAFKKYLTDFERVVAENIIDGLDQKYQEFFRNLKSINKYLYLTDIVPDRNYYMQLLYLESFFLPGIAYLDGLDESTIENMDLGKIRLFNEIENSNYKLYVMDENLIIGCAFAKNYDNNVRIVSAMIHPLFRGYGIGTNMITMLFRQIEDARKDPITLTTWLADLGFPYKSPYNFWSQMGFINVTKDYYYNLNLHKEGTNPSFSGDLLVTINKYYKNGLSAIKMVRF